MQTFRDLPIRQKLVVVIMASTAAALLLAGIGIVIFDSILFRGYLERDLSALASIIADNSTASLAFNDPASAAETLSALRERPHIVTACIHRLDGSTLATYLRPGADTACPSALVGDTPQFTPNGLVIARSVSLAGRQIGTLMMLYDLKEILERMRLYAGIVLGVLLASSFFAFLLSSRLRAVIATPISLLVHASTSVAESNDYSIRAPKLGADELGVLVDRFNEMLAGIESRDDHLRQALRDREIALRDAENARERFRFMAESMPQKIFTATPTGEIDYFNRQWMDFTGLTFEQIRDWGWTQFVHPDDVGTNVSTWRHAIETGEPFHFQQRFRRADGEYRWHLSRAHAMRDDAGLISMWIGSNTDIHEQKEKEQELRRANDDLEQFAYSASHDLQEPIRNVVVYSEIIEQRYDTLLDEEGHQFLGFLIEGGRRLATLINDLLAYTRAGMAESNPTVVDASKVLQDTLASLAEAIRESQATVTYDTLPAVFMGEAHLQQIFLNLIGNALKYRGEEAPRIHISAASSAGDWRFAVQDNGIGIDPEYKEKIFGVFKRLHRDQKYAGTGIGLAICQRVVGRYGGRIWVESEPGKGSTFCFTIPRHAQRIQPAAANTSAGGGQSS